MLFCSVISSTTQGSRTTKWLLGAVQPAAQGSEAAVVCADGVCRLVPASTLQRGADVSVQSPSQSMPPTRSSASGITSTRSAPVCSSSRRMDANMYSIGAGEHPSYFLAETVAHESAQHCFCTSSVKVLAICCRMFYDASMPFCHFSGHHACFLTSAYLCMTSFKAVKYLLSASGVIMSKMS